MPRNGKLVRSALALAAAGLVAALAVTSAGAAGTRSTGTLNGAGSSLIAPAVAVWGSLYKADTINYSAIGSGGGISQISARNVDFGASDAPMTKSQGDGCNGCVQIPWALTATSPVVNIPGVHADQLRLTGTVLANIYLGNITKWDDPALKQLNPGLNLPDMKIVPVHRSDSSGDTYVFTNYLSKVNKAWKSKVGCATTVSWPTGVGGNKNNGVAAIIGSTPGTIGYVSIAYTIANHLSLAKLKNAAGSYVLPTVKTIESAAQLVKSTKIPANNKISITNPPKSKKYKNAWPMSTFTYVIVPTSSPKAAQI
ncbi:MAG TPA: phosphate ABC transporter substrate-binding protein PstS, partial [Gaiellaceae bacterium]|nr:phosphate ABC transporter substrate-binding protein PstS [Gaiellaceae bacterium]